MLLENRRLMWYKGFVGIGDRIHHIVQMLEVAERTNAYCIADFREGMFGELGEDAFGKWFTCPHPLFIESPDFKLLESQFSSNQIPASSAHFQVHPPSEMPWLILDLSRKVAFRFGKPRISNPLIHKLLRKMSGIIRPQILVDAHTRIPIAPLGKNIQWGELDRPMRHLYIDVVRKPNWSAARMVWPKPEAIATIESAWKDLRFDPSQCAAIHVRQTDKSTKGHWRKWIEEIKQGKRFANCSQLFIATDSRTVLEAFKSANLNQTVLHNPWLTLPEDEQPLHLSGQDGEWVMRTALFDLWTCSASAEFQPWRSSSFSRVILAWRAFMLERSSTLTKPK